MKAGLTITEMAQEIERQSTAKADYLVNPQALEMEALGGPPMLRVLDSGGVDQMEPLVIQETAHRQMGAYLGIPWKYYDKMLQEDPDLLAYNVNRWFQTREPTQRLLRTIGDMQGARFESCQITENYMYIKVVNPKLTGEVRVGDIVQSGVVISNSETGLGAVNVQPLVYRLACLNGMVVNDAKAATRRNHVGRASRTEENFAIYSQETLDADSKAIMMKVRDSVRAAVDEAQFAKVLSAMKDSTEAKLNTADIPSVVKLASSNFGLTEAEGQGVFQHLIQDADYTLYGLANAVTRFSQDVEDYDRASKLEEIGYSVMTMSPALFRHINQVTSMAV